MGYCILSAAIHLSGIYNVYVIAMWLSKNYCTSNEPLHIRISCIG